MKGENIETYLTNLKNYLLKSKVDDNSTITCGYGVGECERWRFPTKPHSIFTPMRTTLAHLDNRLGSPGINVVGLVEAIGKKGINISNLLQNAPANTIWINVGENPLILKVLSDGIPNSWTVNPGFGFVLGNREVF